MTNSEGPKLLEGLQIGAPLFGSSGRTGATILNTGITAVNPKIQKTMDLVTSNSQYTHNAISNSGSLSVSGSYGVSGISRIEAGLSVSYTGESSKATDALSIEMQRIVVAGIEYVDFDSLAPEEFIAALKGAPNPEASEEDGGRGIYQLMVDVLVAYDELFSDGVPEDLNALLSDKSQELQAWCNAKENFFNHAGDMVVVAIAWGGWGGASLAFESVTSETLWKLGVKGKFSYADVDSSVSVEASYGHMELTEDQKKSGTVEGISHGNCVAEMVNTWVNELKNRLDNNIDKVDKTTVGSLPSTPIPSIGDLPELVKPKSSKDIADKVGKVKDMKGLEALAKAAAYDAHTKEAKKKGVEPKLLKEFLREAEEENDVDGLDDHIDPAAYDDDNLGGDDRLVAPVLAAGENRAARPAAAAKGTFTDFIAVGAWFAPWGQIFPWLAEAQDNGVPKGAFNSALARLRMLESDARSLAMTYAQLHATGVKIKTVDLGFDVIAGAFETMAKHAHDLLHDHMSVLGGKYDKDQLDEKMKSDVLKKLAPAYRTIYRTWIETPLLRSCELGAGIEIVVPKASNLTLNGLKHNTTHKTDKDKDKEFFTFVCSETSGFDSETKNHEAFAASIKATPVILPDGTIVALINWPAYYPKEDPKEGKGINPNNPHHASGFLCASEHQNHGLFVAKDWAHGTDKEPGKDNYRHAAHRHALTFSFHTEPDGNFQSGTDGDHLFSHAPKSKGTDGKRNGVRLWPIPYTAAKNVDTWIGASSSLGISDITDKLEAMKMQLSDLKRMTLGHECWSKRKSEAPLLALQNLAPSYVGLVEEPDLFKPGN